MSQLILLASVDIIVYISSYHSLSCSLLYYTRNTIFAVTREARVKGYHSFSLVLKHRKIVHFRNVIRSYRTRACS